MKCFASAPGVVAPIRHGTWTRSDATLEADGALPPERAERDLPLGVYPLASQFGRAPCEADADAYCRSSRT